MSPKKMNLVLKISLVAIAVIILSGVFLADSKLSDLAINTSKLKAEIEVTNKKLDNYELTKVKIDELSYVKDLAAKILPQSEDQSVVVAELSDFAKRSNLTTGSISFVVDDTLVSKDPAAAAAAAKTKPPDGVKIVPVEFTVSGSASYEDVLSFLKYIEQNRRKMQVTEISLTPDSEKNGSLKEISISLNLFVKSPEKEKK